MQEQIAYEPPVIEPLDTDQGPVEAAAGPTSTF